MKKTSFEDYVKGAQAKHGDIYEYKSLDGGVIRYVCKTHGEIEQNKFSFMRGQGCPKCTKASVADRLRDDLFTFVKKAKEVHGDSYEYMTIEGKDVRYRCYSHGEVTQDRSGHLSGAKCYQCAVKDFGKGRRDSFEEYVLKARSKHRDKFTYVRFDSHNVVYTCPTHGEQNQNKKVHLRNYGCPKCGRDAAATNIAWSFEGYVKKAKEVHGETYEYQQLTKTNIEYKCKQHGEVSQVKSTHLQGHGCPKCGQNMCGKKCSDSFDEVVRKAKEKHGDKYFYKEVDQSYLIYDCPAHGEIMQRTGSHLTGYGCVKCGNEKVADALRWSLKEYTKEAAKNNNLADLEYLETDRKSVLFECVIHGVQVQNKQSHLRGRGCPSCVAKERASGFSEKVESWLKEAKIDYTAEDNTPYKGSRRKADFVVGNLAIELNGNFWHTEDRVGTTRHFEKLQLAQSNGYELIMFSDAEWDTKGTIIKKSIVRRLRVDTGVALGARALNLRRITGKDSRNLLEENHIQGYASAEHWYGLYQDEELVAVAGFSMKTTGRGGKASAVECELIRYCAKTPVTGGCSRLIACAKAELGFSKLNTFSDDRYFTGGMYSACGFSPIRKIAPSYSYIRYGKPVSKASLQKSAFANNPKLLYDPALTERELAELNGFKRIYDAGKTLWVKTYK